MKSLKPCIGRRVSQPLSHICGSPLNCPSLLHVFLELDWEQQPSNGCTDAGLGGDADFVLPQLSSSETFGGGISPFCHCRLSGNHLQAIPVTVPELFSVTLLLIEHRDLSPNALRDKVPF